MLYSEVQGVRMQSDFCMKVLGVEKKRSVEKKLNSVKKNLKVELCKDSFLDCILNFNLYAKLH